MKYMLLIHQGDAPTPHSEDWESVPEEEKSAIYADYKAINETPAVTPGHQMQPPESATTVRVDGRTLTTDGPFVATGLIGFLGDFDLAEEAAQEAFATAAAGPATGRPPTRALGSPEPRATGRSTGSAVIGPCGGSSACWRSGRRSRTMWTRRRSPTSGWS